MGKVIEERYVLTDADPNITAADAVAATWSDVWKYTVPVGIKHVLLPEHTFAAYLIDSQGTPVEAVGTVQVKIEVRDPSGNSRDVIFGPTIYTAVKEFQDRNKKARLDLSKPLRLEEGELLVVMVNDPTQTIDEASSYFALDTQRFREGIGR